MESTLFFELVEYLAKQEGYHATDPYFYMQETQQNKFFWNFISHYLWHNPEVTVKAYRDDDLVNDIPRIDLLSTGTLTVNVSPIDKDNRPLDRGLLEFKPYQDLDQATKQAWVTATNTDMLTKVRDWLDAYKIRVKYEKFTRRAIKRLDEQINTARTNLTEGLQHKERMVNSMLFNENPFEKIFRQLRRHKDIQRVSPTVSGDYIQLTIATKQLYMEYYNESLFDKLCKRTYDKYVKEAFLRALNPNSKWRYAMGEYRIVLSYDAYQPEKLQWSVSLYGGAGANPHQHFNNCLGGFSQDVAEAVGRGDAVALVHILITWLQTVALGERSACFTDNNQWFYVYNTEEQKSLSIKEYNLMIKKEMIANENGD